MLSGKIKFLATVYTILLLGSLAALLLIGGFRFKSPQIKGKVIQATMVDISELKANKKPQPQPKKQTPPPVKEKQPEKQPPKKEEQKKPPVKKDPPPVKKEVPPIKKETPKIDTKAQELERKKRLEREKKIEEIRKKRKEAEERAKQEEENLKKLVEQEVNENTKKVEPQPVANKKGKSESDKLNELMTRYQLAVIAAVEREWSVPAIARKDLLCRVKVRQIPGGGVIDATISSPCNASEAVKSSIIAAIKKADPLPYMGFEDVFNRNAVFSFALPKN